MFSLPRVNLPWFLGGSADSPNSSSSSSGFSGNGITLGKNEQGIRLPSVQRHSIERGTEKRTRTVKHLLRASHSGFQALGNETTGLLAAAYGLGASAEGLNGLYEGAVEGLEAWRDAPGEITKDDWREFLGKKEYQRAFVDFFEDQLVAHRYELGLVLEEFLFGGAEPLVNGLFSGSAQQFIHLANAYKLESTTLAIEGLTLAACCYTGLHCYIDNPTYTRKSPHTLHPPDLLYILDKVREDNRFDDAFVPAGDDVLGAVQQQEELLLEYWNAWDVNGEVDLTGYLKAAQEVSVAFLFAGRQEEHREVYDGLLARVLITAHALRVLLPHVPARFHLSLLRQWWLFTLAVYVSRSRPLLRTTVKSGDTGKDSQDKDWRGVVREALEGQHREDAQYVQVLQALKEAAETWTDESQLYHSAAIRFAEGFEAWHGP